MTTRVTLPPLEATPDTTPSNKTQVPVAKVQLLNDRGDRQAEATWLAEAARPGVAELLSTSDDPFTIVTAHAGTRTMRTARLEPEAGLALLTQTTDLLAQLHHDGFVHGKLTVDHVIVGSEGPVLCSPDGTVSDPQTDLAGVARCMRELARQWDEANKACSWRHSWDELAARLEAATDPSNSAKRATQTLLRMATLTEPPASTTKHTNRSSKGLVAAGCAVAVAIAGIGLVPTSEPVGAAGPLVVVGGSTYAVGHEGDDAAYLDNACDPGAPVVTLRPSTGEIWAFRSISDGALSEPIAVVPGATELRSEQRTKGERSCRVAVARGPAGATEIDTASLMFANTADNTPTE